MKSIVLGNPSTDWWKLSIEDVSIREQVVALGGELHAGFFVATTPMCIAPAVLSRFAADLRELDRTLAGAAILENATRQSAVRLKLAVDHVGHVHTSGRYQINGNALDFTFSTDQTQLAPLAGWIERVVDAYGNKKP